MTFRAFEVPSICTRMNALFRVRKLLDFQHAAARFFSPPTRLPPSLTEGTLRSLLLGGGPVLLPQPRFPRLPKVLLRGATALARKRKGSKK